MDYPTLRYATWLLRRDRKERKAAHQALREKAVACIEAGQLEEAEGLYQQLLAQDGKQATWWRELGALYRKGRKHEAAATALLRSLELDGSAADCHHDFGVLLEQLDHPTAAIARYLAIMGLEDARLPPGEVAGWPALLRAAAALVESRLDAQADQVETYCTLGHLAMTQQRVAKAAESYEAAHRLKPDDSVLARALAAALRLRGEDARAAFLLGHALYREGRYTKAIREFERGLALGEGEAASLVELAASLYQDEQYAKAIHVCQAGIKRYPEEPSLYREWVWALETTNQADAAATVAANAAERLKDPLFLAHERYLALPTIYESAEEIGRYRARFSAGLRGLAEELNRQGDVRMRQPVNSLRTNFYLAYQGLDDLALQEKYGALIHCNMSANYPEWSSARLMPSLDLDDRMRIGYIYQGNSGIDPLFLGWLQHHDRARFDVISYQIGGRVDPAARLFEAASAAFHHMPEDLEGICQQIVNDRLHILVFLYIGMGSLFSQLAGLRLAPIQCATWGHPVTTGLPTIDYFISNQAMEPPDADAHYSETLVRLPGIGVALPPPFLPPLLKTRQTFELPGDAVVYFSPQAFSKYLPQCDHVFAAIAGRVPKALFVLIDHGPPPVTDILRNRLRRAFAQAGLDSEQFVRFLPSQAYYDYLELIRHCDVFLDTFGWTGGLTTLDAVGCALPVVTTPGELMRGRQSYGILSQMGITDTIAASVEDYIEIAVRLGVDADWRQEISRMMRERQSRLYHDQTCVQALEEFYRRIVHERLENG